MQVRNCGVRLIARKNGARVRLYNHSGHQGPTTFRSICACASLPRKGLYEELVFPNQADLIELWAHCNTSLLRAVDREINK